MSEIYAAVHDALSRALVPVVQMAPKAMPDRPVPWYLTEPLSRDPEAVRARGRAQMLALAARYPRNVKGYDA
jgi:hypothetical protein